MKSTPPHTPKGRTIVIALIFAVVLAAGFLVGRAVAGQPHMKAALDHLEAAKAELQTAEADKGGHRVAAIKLVNQAIDEVKAGMAFAASH